MFTLWLKVPFGGATLDLSIQAREAIMGSKSAG